MLSSDSSSLTAALPCLLGNRPGVFHVPSRHWRLCIKYLDTSDTLNIAAFSDTFGDVMIPAEVGTSSQYSAPRVYLTIRELLQRILAGEPVYGKDWHFLLHKDDEADSLFEVPEPFKDDWLNWYWINCCNEADDYRFIYLGGRSTFTAMHHDVLKSFSWSVNICGRKRWLLWPPSSDDLSGFSETEVTARLGQPVEFIQEPGFAVFVPSGWYHIVENLGSSGPNAEDLITMSVNHNWLNGFNIYAVWKFIAAELKSVKKELLCFRRDVAVRPTLNCAMMSDLEWHAHCNTVLKANSSFSVCDFMALLSARLMLFRQLSDLKAVCISDVPSWAAAFCPYYVRKRPEISPEDEHLYDILLMTPICCRYIDIERSDESLSVSRNDLWDWLMGEINEIDEILGESLNVAQFSVLEILRVVKEIQLHADFADTLSSVCATPVLCMLDCMVADCVKELQRMSPK